MARSTNKSVIQNKLHYAINGLEWAEACKNWNIVETIRGCPLKNAFVGELEFIIQ